MSTGHTSVSPRLMPGYNHLARLMGATEMYWRLVAQAAIVAGSTVLEIGCGTGNVIVRAKTAAPSATAIGLDPDPDSLAVAGRRAAAEGLELRLDRGSATDLPYADGSTDRVLSSLMLHHLPADEQVPALREVLRVLAPGGSLHLVDLDVDPRTAGAQPLLLRLLSLLHRLRTRPDGPGRHGHGHGRARPVLEVLADAGFTAPVAVGHGRTRMGAVTYYRAER